MGVTSHDPLQTDNITMDSFAVIGDSHGYFTSPSPKSGKCLHTLLPTIPLDTVQIGDYGIFDGQDVRTLRKVKKREGYTDSFFCGNHDNPELCAKQSNWLGRYGILPNRPSVMFFGGAESCDVKPNGFWAGRVEGKDWWKDEQLDHEEMLKALQLYQDTKPDIVLSHDCPKRCYGLLSFTPGFKYWEWAEGRTPDFLDRLMDIHKPRMWVHGHHHQARSYEVDGCRFRCLDELEVIEVRL